jgi:hypothetical protein
MLNYANASQTPKTVPYHVPRAVPGENEDERIKRLEAGYRNMTCRWATPYVMDCAFNAFLSMSWGSMGMAISQQEFGWGQYRGLALEAYAHHLFAVTGMIGAIRELGGEDKDLGEVRLGPWKSYSIFHKLGEVNTSKGYYNQPCYPHESGVAAIVPFNGIIFQIGYREPPPTNWTVIEEILSTSIFDDFRARKPNKPIQLIWLVERRMYEEFPKEYEQANHGLEIPEQCSHLALRVVEIPLRSIFKWMDLKKPSPVRMRPTKLAKAVETVKDVFQRPWSSISISDDS